MSTNSSAEMNTNLPLKNPALSAYLCPYGQPPGIGEAREASMQVTKCDKLSWDHFNHSFPSFSSFSHHPSPYIPSEQTR